MKKASVQREIVVFPTDLALRRYQMEQALADGFCRTAGHVSMSGLLRCLRDVAVEPIAIRSSVSNVLGRKQAVETARGHFEERGALAQLSSAACEVVLEKVEKELAQLPLQAEKILEWLHSHPAGHRLHQIGLLYEIWRAQGQQEGVLDAVEQHRRVLRLLRKDEVDWPPFLKGVRRIVFRDVRWFSPFEEQVVLRLNERLQLRVESTLPYSHSDMQSETLGQRVLAEIQTEPWAGWAEELGDAWVMESAEMLSGLERSSIDFSRSAGAYGEIEDVARRIVWYMEAHQTPPHRFAIVVPNMSMVQDVVPHVFGRFGLPYYFRRGRPVLSSPCVKAFMGWLAYPIEGSRDGLIDLIRHPAIRMEMREQQVEDLLKAHPHPRLSGFDLEWFKGTQRLSGAEGLERLNQWIIEPEDHFNAKALESLKGALEELKEVALPLPQLVDLLAQLLENETIRPKESREQGIAVMNYEDAVGLEFDWVGFCGMNEGCCPEPVRQDALIHAEEREELRNELVDQQVELPMLALADPSVRMEQQRVRFLSALGMARKQVFFSYSAVNEQGGEQMCGRFYRQVWMLAGWACEHEFALSPYDEWRIKRLPEDNFLMRHAQRQKQVEPVERLPMPGESFLSWIPEALLRTEDEALQCAVNYPNMADPSDEAVPVDFEFLAERIGMEHARADYLNQSEDERNQLIYAGHLPDIAASIRDWLEGQRALSPTALEELTHCRYLFLMNRILKLQVPNDLDDFPLPLDRGKLMHAIFDHVFKRLATGDSAVPSVLVWAVQDQTGWFLSDQPVAEAIPLVRFHPEQKEAVLAFAEYVAREQIAKAVAKQVALGHPAVWAVEQEKLIQSVRTAVAFDVEHSLVERRYPALFEFSFDESLGVSVAGVAIKGKVDRIDLIFDKDGRLDQLHVLDYKGSSREQDKAADYIERVMSALDCQLPLYAFAAQHYFFGVFDTPEVNARTKAGYIIAERDPVAFPRKRKKALISMDEADLTSSFKTSLCEQLDRIRIGDFSVDPYHAGFGDYQPLLRNRPMDDSVV